ncbi:hypothetical protein D3C85_1500250 [compost metagenome]
MRQELRQVMRSDQAVDRQFFLAHRREVRRFERWNDAMVGGDLAVVPRPRALCPVELSEQGVQARVGRD